MSKCISRHGEYSEHEFDNGAGLADEFTCVRCWVVDDAAQQAELDRLRAEVKRYRDAFAGLWIEPDGHGEPCVWMDFHGQPVALADSAKTPLLLWTALAAVIPERES